MAWPSTFEQSRETDRARRHHGGPASARADQRPSRTRRGERPQRDGRSSVAGKLLAALETRGIAL